MSYDNNTFIIIGSGPSLTPEQIQYIKDHGEHAWTIAVNNNYQLAPWADMVFAADLKWWRLHYNEVCDTMMSYTDFYTIDKITKPLFKNIKQRREIIEVPIIRNIELLEKNEYGLFHGGCSGILAMELARVNHAHKIILVGFDMQHTDGKSHWFGDHPKGFLNANACERWINEIAQMMPVYESLGIDVVNCSIETAIDSIRRSTLEDEL